jgi:hypothetical protein
MVSAFIPLGAIWDNRQPTTNKFTVTVLIIATSFVLRTPTLPLPPKGWKAEKNGYCSNLK